MLGAVDWRTDKRSVCRQMLWGVWEVDQECLGRVSNRLVREVQKGSWFGAMAGVAAGLESSGIDCSGMWRGYIALEK